MNSAYHPVTKSPHTQGRFCVGEHELTSGDLIEFPDGDNQPIGRIEHDGVRYVVFVLIANLSYPLVELPEAAYVGRGGL